MSKRFGINTKSAEARARKDAVKDAKEKEKQQRLEDEYWKDDDKHVQRKQQRKVGIVVDGSSFSDCLIFSGRTR